jgi:hypothetical protein
MNLSNLNRDYKLYGIVYKSIKKYISIKYDGEQIWQMDLENDFHSHVNILSNGSYRKYNSDGSNSGHFFEDGRTI